MQTAATWEDIDTLTPWRKNPRRNDASVAHVARSIQRFGFGAPLLVRTSDRVVIAGHTRLKAAQQLGLDKVPVRFLDLDPAQARALALADNKLGELAEWDDTLLAEVLAELDEEVDLAGLGWSDEDLEALIAGPEPDLIGGDSDPDTSADDQLPAEVPAITQPGEIIAIGRHTLHCRDCVGFLQSLPENSIDAIVTDPPYGIGFMGKGWDSAVPGDVYAAACLRVLKPGGHIIAFAATRTIHRLTVHLEDAGFEIRDQIQWLQWQGFPKSHDVSKAIDAHLGVERTTATGRAYTVPNAQTVNPHFVAIAEQRTEGSRTKQYQPMAPATPEAHQWNGWGTALKPAAEPAVLARKPLTGTVAENVMEWGVGGLNVDGCRHAEGDTAWPGPGGEWTPGDGHQSPSSIALSGGADGSLNVSMSTPHALGRWPANIYHCPKPSRGEREEGTDTLPVLGAGSYGFGQDGSLDGRSQPQAANHHPTVKPINLMRWLVRLVTPPGGTVLETFAGSGTTMIAAEREGFTCIATELEPKYCDIIRARLTHAVE